MSDFRTHQLGGRARGLGLPFPGICGPNNAITDVAGLEVGYHTLVEGQGALSVGEGPVRTGVTAILPRGRNAKAAPCWAATFALNGNGEMTGAHWIAEAGLFEGPVLITNTHSVGAAHQGAVRWLTSNRTPEEAQYVWALPVVAETCDAYLNDMNGFHVTEAHVLAAIEGARSGPIAEGNVGGGTGMICYEFKGGTGTASRIVEHGGKKYTIGVLVQANHGLRSWLSVLGVPVGRHLTNDLLWSREQGSIIAILATDLPLLPIQLKRIAKRMSIGIGRAGTPSGDNSGDIFLALSTANAPAPAVLGSLGHLDFILHEELDPIFLAAVEAVDEAVINALIAAETMEGRDGHRARAIDHEALREVMRHYNRLID